LGYSLGKYMSIVLQSSGGGQITIQEPTTASNFTQTLPASTGTFVTTGSPQSGGIIQVVSTTKSDTFSTTSSSFTDITGLSVSITPKFATSKILVIMNLTGGNSVYSSLCTFRLVRDSTAICVGNTTAGYTSATVGGVRQSLDNNASWYLSANFLDSPATTSATTYKVQCYTEGNTLRINTTGSDASVSNWSYRGASTITVMEVAA
jgi:hypothetical protein